MDINNRLAEKGEVVCKCYRFAQGKKQLPGGCSNQHAYEPTGNETVHNAEPSRFHSIIEAAVRTSHERMLAKQTDAGSADALVANMCRVVRDPLGQEDFFVCSCEAEL